MEKLILELSAFIHPDDVDEVKEQIEAILAYHAQGEGVLFKLMVHGQTQLKEVV